LRREDFSCHGSTRPPYSPQKTEAEAGKARGEKTMKRFIGIVLALLLCVPAVQAEKPGPAEQATGAGAPDWKPPLKSQPLFGPLPRQKPEPYMPYQRRPRVHVTPNGIFVGTDEEFRKREEKRQAERKQLEAGAERIRQMEQQYAERSREKGKNALIGLGIVAAVLLVCVLASGSKPTT